MHMLEVYVGNAVSWWLNKQADGLKVEAHGQHKKSSDPQNRLWQLGTHLTNWSKLSNYSLVTRYFVSSLHNKYDTFCISARILYSTKKQLFLFRQEKFKHLDEKIVPKQVFDCRDKERSFFTMASHWQGEAPSVWKRIETKEWWLIK